MMPRRQFLSVIATASAAPTGALASAANRDGSADLAAPLHELSVAQLQMRMARGELTAQALTQSCLDRIEAVDRSGPTLAAVIEVNPDAQQLAATLDRERSAGRTRGPLHGIPVLLKDNVATDDRMQTTAGSFALVGAKAPRDAYLVSRLREAGALILGKTNLSEWANIRSSRSVSGWSARGGLTRNPHVLDRNTSGSSSGSAAAVAAGLAPLTVGTETDGSIVSPASINGIVGFKPTVGLVSRDGIIPIAQSQDTAGPMTRSVADAALLLQVMAGRDQRDPATRPSKLGEPFLALNRTALRGARLGIVRSAFSGNERIDAVHEAALSVLSQQGAILVDQVKISPPERYQESEFSVLLYEFKAGLNAYLQEFGAGAPVRSLADLIAFNETHRAVEMPYFSQELFVRAEGLGGLRSRAYREALDNNHRHARELGIDDALRRHRLDGLVAPTGGVAWRTDLINGDHYSGSFSTPAAVAGYPHLTVPCGFAMGLPVGLSFVGPAWSDARVLGLGYAFEQATLALQAPRFLTSL
jgi:amidase